MSELPDRPDLEQLRRQARELLRAASAGEPDAIARLRAVSDRVTLSTAQLAVAREYGFASWPALRAAAEYRRRMSESALSPHLERPEAAAVRWSFGGASTIMTAAGALSPGALLIGQDQAALDVSLMPSQQTQQRLAGSLRKKVPGLRFVAVLLGQQSAHAEMPRFDDVVVADDKGTRYTLSFDSGVIPREQPGQVRGPMQLRLRLDPLPARECAWLELHGQGKSVTRLLPSAETGIRVSHPAHAPGSPAERELSDLAMSLIELQLIGVGHDAETKEILSQRCSAALARTAQIRQSGDLAPTSELPDQIDRLCAALTRHQPTDSLPRVWSGMLDAAQRSDGPAYHVDIAAGLPPVEGTAIQLDSLISEPGAWRVYLRAVPGWWRGDGEISHGRQVAMSAQAEDNLGGGYLGIFGGGTGHGDYDELALQFRPRLDPLARALKVTFTGTSEQVSVTLDLGPVSDRRDGDDEAISYRI